MTDRDDRKDRPVNGLKARLEAIDEARQQALESGALGSDTAHAEITLAKEAVLEFMREAADKYCDD
ncbi:MAG: hypothetical protein F4109_02665 [Gammaproteobacteria bacterium]|nr:hypothetical protein [Gammaproteobacteria bacterium]